ncbi:MAG: tetratricopeptide repeat protein [Sandaracinaceae bacterium]
MSPPRSSSIAVVCAVLLQLVPLPLSAQPTCADLVSCRERVETGDYAAAEAGLRRLREPAAQLLLARLLYETGRYDDAIAAAQRLGSNAAVRVPAMTLAGDALAARGRLDDAQRAYEAVSREPTAHRARVGLGRVWLRRGRDAEARGPLMQVVQAYNDETIGPRDAEGLALVGMAAAALGSAHDANDALLESMRVEPTRVETQLELADLFLGHYDPGHAEDSLNDALARNPHCARAHALLARVKLEQSYDFEGASAELDLALAVDPSLVLAHVTRAAIAIRDADYALADQHLERALAIDPNDLEALSTRAAVRFLSDDTRGYEAAIREVLARHPRYARMFTIIAEFADWEHRYEEIVAMARRGLTLSPDDPLSNATLGLNLLRMGEETEGLAALRAAQRRDRFNVRVHNTIRFFDGPIARDYESFDAAPFRFRMHSEERPVMERSATRTLRRAYDDMRRRYAFTPHAPIHIEMFSNVEHFSVRTAGLPNIGVQGVCFGRVLTALSPRAGPFNWAQIVTHELAHVFHIQMSNDRVPRWFTEGLAEYESLLARPEWRREEDHQWYPALAAGRFPPVAQLTRAFTHARSAEDVTVAYYGSSLLVKYIAERFGFERIPRMLREWGQRRSTEDVIQRVLGISHEQLDRDFRQSELSRMAARANDFDIDYAAYRDVDAIRARAEAEPRSADAQAALAVALFGEHDMEGADRAMRAALRIDRHQPVARMLGAQLAWSRRDPRTAAADLRLLRADGHDGYVIRMVEGRAAMARRDGDTAAEAFAAASRIDPERPEAWRDLLELLGDREPQARLLALRHLVDIDQHDREANFALLQAYAEAEDWANVREYGERAVYTDPLRSEARRLYAEGLIRSDAREAIAQAEAALTLEPSSEAAQATLARARAAR